MYIKSYDWLDSTIINLAILVWKLSLLWCSIFLKCSDDLNPNSSIIDFASQSQKTHPFYRKKDRQCCVTFWFPTLLPTTIHSSFTAKRQTHLNVSVLSSSKNWWNETLIQRYNQYSSFYLIYSISPATMMLSLDQTLTVLFCHPGIYLLHP